MKSGHREELGVPAFLFESARKKRESKGRVVILSDYFGRAFAVLHFLSTFMSSTEGLYAGQERIFRRVNLVNYQS